jgi:hypothetical protein
MNIPKSVKISGIIYDVIEIEPKDGNLVKIKNWGEINHGESKIYLDKTIEPQRKWKILFHEILHAIELDNDLDSSEQYIQTISCSFYAFLKDNNLLKD